MTARLITSLVLLAGALSACSDSAPAPSANAAAQAELAAHSAEFRRELIHVTEGVHVAVGFGLANSILLEGGDGIVVVDTLETREQAAEALAAFRTVTDKPLAAIVYTHNHVDHIFGAGAFDPDGQVPVYAHRSTARYIHDIVNVIRPVMAVRSARMFGSHLEGRALENAGIGPFLGINAERHVDLRLPTETVDRQRVVQVAGLTLELHHAPGETDDQLFVWLPQQRTLLPGDNFYRAFPNLYTLRGTHPRDVDQWVASIDHMLEFPIEHLVPSHGRPLHGAEAIRSALTDYRDAMQYVHDQTVYWMNRGLTPERIVEQVQLPPQLAASPYLQPFYGQVDWSVRAIFDGYLGWFSGDATDLAPLPPAERAALLAQLAERDTPLKQALGDAIAAQQWSWALQLARALNDLNQQDQQVRSWHAHALTRLGEQSQNANARHYYLTQAEEVLNGLQPGVRTPVEAATVHSIPLAQLFTSMRVSLNAERAGQRQLTVAFEFTDSGEAWHLTLRNGVLVVKEGRTERADIRLALPAWLWKEVSAQLRNPGVAFLRSDVRLQGSLAELVGFLRLFDPMQ